MPFQGFNGNARYFIHRALPYANGSEPFRLKKDRNLPK